MPSTAQCSGITIAALPCLERDGTPPDLIFTSLAVTSVVTCLNTNSTLLAWVGRDADCRPKRHSSRVVSVVLLQTTS